jgi:tetratricopeptide (TPR) repeat protein
LERVTLQQAAIIGDEFWDSAVQQLSRASRFAFDQEQVVSALRSLEQRDMIFRAPLSDFSGSRAYLFRHSILREVTYQSVLLRDRPGYHLQAARWLEVQSNNRAVDYSAPIAQHHELAGQLAEATRLYELAATRAMEQYKLGSAIEHYRKVLDLLRYRPHDLDTYLNVYWRLGRALQIQARLIEALEVYRTMRHTAEREGNLAGQARAENAIASVYLEQGDNERALAAASHAEELARLAGEPMELTWALLRGGAAAGCLERYGAAVEKVTQAVELGRQLAAPPETARALALLAMLLTRSGDHAAARRVEDEVARFATELEVKGDEAGSAFALTRLGESNLSNRAYDKARANLRRAIEMYKTENQAEAAEAQRLLGLAACRAGNTPEGIEHLEAAATLAETMGNRYLWLGCRLGLGEALLAQAQYPAAEATLRQVIAAAEDSQRLGDWVELLRAYDLLVEVLVREGRGEEAAWVEKHRRRAGR